MNQSLPCRIVFKEISIPIADDSMSYCRAKAEVYPFNKVIPNPPTIQIGFKPSVELCKIILQELNDESMKCFTNYYK